MIPVTPKRLGYACGYAANPRSYVSYAVTRHFDTCACTREAIPTTKNKSPREQIKTTCNRVTHVTTGLSRVTDRVTNTFPRNYERSVVMNEKNRDEMQAWVKENLPACAAVANEFKAVFGDVRLVYACENGHELGKKTPQRPERTVRLSDCQIGPMNAPQRDSASRKGK